MAFAYRNYPGQCETKAYLVAEPRTSRLRHGMWRGPSGTS